MNYPFWIQDFNRITNYYQDKYLSFRDIQQHPSNLFGMDNPKKPKKHGEIYTKIIKKSILSTTVLVLVDIPNRDEGRYSKGGA